MTILTKTDLAEQYKLTPSFIRKHRMAMGGMGKPLRFDKDLVESFLHDYFRTELDRKAAEDRRSAEIAASVDKVVRLRTVYPARTEMRGRGGRAL